MPDHRKPEAVMQLDLSDDDAELPEIVHTDNPGYRHMLKARRDRLRGMLNLLGGPLAAQRHSQAR
jgi:hypothetical protein